MTPIHAPFYHHMLDSIAEWHAITIGLALGIAVGLVQSLGFRGTAGYVLGVVSGVVVALWYSGALTYWPAHGHAWYIVAPTAAIGFLLSKVL